MKIFGAKTLFKLQLSGPVKKRKVKYDNKYNAYEERVVLIFAKDFKSAMLKAEKDAKKYESTHISPFGQKVNIKFLKCVDLFELYDDLRDLEEVYSTTLLIHKKSEREDSVRTSLWCYS